MHSIHTIVESLLVMMSLPTCPLFSSHGDIQPVLVRAGHDSTERHFGLEHTIKHSGQYARKSPTACYPTLGRTLTQWVRHN